MLTLCVAARLGYHPLWETEKYYQQTDYTIFVEKTDLMAMEAHSF